MFFAAFSALRGAAEASTSRLFGAGPSRSLKTIELKPPVHLANLQPAKGSTRANLRRGRGPGSRTGGTAGRGHKGQLARSGNGKPTPAFAGGQTPITRLFPKRGFINFTRRAYAPLPLARLQQWIAQQRIDPRAAITVGTVVRSNAIHGISGNAGVKLVGAADPELPLPPLELELSRYSKGAAQAVIDAGGKVTAVYHNNLSLRQEVYPEKFATPVKSAKPIRRTDIEFYSNPANHGYLAKEEAAKEAAQTEQAVESK